MINNSTKYNGETICHFPGSPGCVVSKKFKMTNFMESMFSEENNYMNLLNPLIHKKFTWSSPKGHMLFLEEGKVKVFGFVGSYKFIDTCLIKITFEDPNKKKLPLKYLLKFNYNYSEFIAIKNFNFEIVYGSYVSNL